MSVNNNKNRINNLDKVKKIFRENNFPVILDHFSNDDPLLEKGFSEDNKYFSKDFAPVLNIIATSSIFNGRKDSGFQIHQEKNKNYSLIAFGDSLSPEQFNIYVALIAMFDHQNNNSITVSLRELSKAAGINTTNLSRTDYCKKLYLKLMGLNKCYFHVTIADQTYYFRLIGNIKPIKSKELKPQDILFRLTLDYDLSLLYKRSDVRFTIFCNKSFKDIKGNYAKSLYRYLLAMRSNKKPVFSKHKSCIEKILGISDLPNNKKNRIIKETIQRLVEQKLIEVRVVPCNNKNDQYIIRIIKRLHG